MAVSGVIMMKAKASMMTYISLNIRGISMAAKIIWRRDEQQMAWRGVSEICAWRQ